MPRYVQGRELASRGWPGEFADDVAVTLQGAADALHQARGRVAEPQIVWTNGDAPVGKLEAPVIPLRSKRMCGVTYGSIYDARNGIKWL